ncbi:MAG: serine hydrolase, partial [Lacticaseibacillus sp.]
MKPKYRSGHLGLRSSHKGFALVNAFKGVGFKMSGKHRYIWLGVMLILCAVSIGAG